MCGIAGLLALHGRTPSSAHVEDMLRVLAHRGPDGHGVAALGPCVLGHRRLAIIDVSERGAQPLAAEGLTVTYNGEVYNYLELRRELEDAGVQFDGDTDTEVVVRALARWGVDALPRFNGMFALALWNPRERSLLLARDRFGIKPLYLCTHADTLRFASEPKALLLHDPELRRPDPAALGAFLTLGHQDVSERTLFAAVRQLPPGTWLRIDASGRRTEGRYYSLPERPPHPVSGDEFRALLEDAVRLRLRADVPVGTCLSGGLDSSAIASLAARHSPTPVRTFTAVYPDRGCDERRYARAVVRTIGAEPLETAPRPRSLVGLMDRLGWYHDEPAARPGILTQWHVMESVQRRVTVLLDGQGADETLGGYAYYSLPLLRARLGSDWRAWGRDAWGLLGQPVTSEAGHGSLLWLLGKAVSARWQRSARHAPDLVRAARTLVHPPLGGRDPYDAILRADLLRWSIPSLLHYEDRTSMAFSLEARVPFLDHRLVELALSIPLADRVRGAATKWVLREALRDVLPREVLERTDKLGYPTPWRRWLQASAPEVTDVLAQFVQRDLVERQDVWRVWEATRHGHGDPWQIYRWVGVELWWRRFLDASPGAGPPSNIG